MNIWLIDHYAVPPQYYPLARQTNFAKHLLKMGHKVKIFAASTVHNSTVNLIAGRESYKEINSEGVDYVLIKCKQYTGNGIKRVLNMFEFAFKLTGVCSKFEKPDAIVSTSMTLMACAAGLRIGKKLKCKNIAQITDLWPETLIAYGIASKYNPAVLFLRRLEKWIYRNADKIIFSMEGGYDYIVEQGWDKEIPKQKTYYINNGIELAQFDHNKEVFVINDIDLNSTDFFKVVYTGSIRKVNNLGKLLDIAKNIKNGKVKFLIWGDGDELTLLQKRINNENIDNVVFKGKVDKKYIPYITSKADLNIMHGSSSPLMRFGFSANKLFDYLASGVPIICDFFAKYNPVVLYNAGFTVESGEVKDIARCIDDISNLDKVILYAYGHNARNGAEEFDFTNLTQKLISIIKT